MPLHESDSIILKTYPLAEADRIVVFFTRDYGKLRGVANGVRKIKSRFGASLEPMAHSRVTFFQKETQELVRIRSSELIDSPMKLLVDYDRAVLASHVTDLVDRFLPDHDTQDPVFRLFVLARSGLIHGMPLDLVRVYFEVWMLRLSGVFPDIFVCSECRRGLDGHEQRVLLPGMLHVACLACSRERGIDLPAAAVVAIRWVIRNRLVAPRPDDAQFPEGSGLQHVIQLNRLWMDRYFER
jgi:DNA repair protein RecO (recombination protein O)